MYITCSTYTYLCVRMTLIFTLYRPLGSAVFHLMCLWCFILIFSFFRSVRWCFCQQQQPRKNAKKKKSQHSHALSHSYNHFFRRCASQVCMFHCASFHDCVEQIQCDDDVFQCYCLMHNNDATVYCYLLRANKSTHTRKNSRFFSSCAQFSVVVCSAMLFSNTHTHMILDAETVWLMLLYIYSHSHAQWLCVIAYALECASVRVCAHVFLRVYEYVLFCSVCCFETKRQHLKPKTK